MNQKTTYEQLITEKLEGMPVPDMADAIWARIEHQLDIDMPTDDSGTDPEPKSPSGSGWIGGAGLFVFVAALVTIFLINKNKNKSNASNPYVPVIQRTDSMQRNPVFQTASDSNIISEKRPQVVTQDVPIKSAPAVGEHMINKDTSVAFPQGLTPHFNSDTQQQVVTNVPPPVRQDSTKPKKSRGVQGITDNDYRIVPVAKDSTKGQQDK
jgi:hypothetical protein